MKGLRVINLNKKYRLNEAFIARLVSKILKLLKKSQAPAEIEVVFLGDRAMRAFNKRYTHRDRTTDVLSFRLDSDGAGGSAFFADILVSSDTVFRNSKVFKTGFARELILYVIHGILHLFGYDDRRPEDRRGMRKKEEELLSRLCRSADLSRVSMTR